MLVRTLPCSFLAGPSIDKDVKLSDVGLTTIWSSQEYTID